MAERVGKDWTPEEEKFLQWNWGVISPFDIAKKLDRSAWGVAQHATKILDLGPASRGTWSISAVSRYSGFDEVKIWHAIEKLGMNIAYAIRTDPRRGKTHKTKKRAVTDDQVDEIIKYMMDHPYIYSDKPGKKRTTAGVWGIGLKPPQCVKCGKTDRPHAAKGFCTRCYASKFRREAPPSKNKTGRAAFDNPVLTAEQVEQIRWRRFRGETIQGLAAEFGVSRQAVSQIVKGRVWKHAGGPIEPYTNANVWERTGKSPDTA